MKLSWLQSGVQIINEMDLIPHLTCNLLMWAIPLGCEVIVSIDPESGDVLCTKQTERNIQYLIPIQKLRPIPFTPAQNIIEAYPIMLGQNCVGDERPIPTLTKIRISNVYFKFPFCYNPTSQV
eukprot:TRINITY_DN16998_c0_g1_i1.p1 TRINITY_DN16998_c0_g1~~TRINITY_DN16998_c0_g1_i1.p1  ORF type:complete len:123 (+),score=2.12 TRINITY_DN16998_c0_g1_i1:172-540(+)